MLRTYICTLVGATCRSELTTTDIDACVRRYIQDEARVDHAWFALLYVLNVSKLLVYGRYVRILVIGVFKWMAQKSQQSQQKDKSLKWWKVCWVITYVLVAEC